MKNCSNDKENGDKSDGVFLDDGIKTVRKNSVSNDTSEEFSFTQSNFLKLLEENIKLRASVTELNNTLGSEVTNLKYNIFKIQKEHDETMQLLELQAKSHREDWEAERREKNSYQSQVQILKNQLHLLTVKFAEYEVENVTCKCNCGHMIQTSRSDHMSEMLLYNPVEKKSRKNKSPNSLSQKNAKCSNVAPSSATAESPSPTKNLIYATKGERFNNSDSCFTKENVKEPLHKRNHSKQCVKDNHIKQTDKEIQIIPNCNREKSQSVANATRYNGEKNKKDIAISSISGESTGTKSKLSKGSLSKEKSNNIDAKKRARTILASALPISPTSSTPSSPIQSPTRRHIEYLPITSTVLTNVSYGTSVLRGTSSEDGVFVNDEVKSEERKNVVIYSKKAASPIRKNSKLSLESSPSTASPVRKNSKSLLDGYPVVASPVRKNSKSSLDEYPIAESPVRKNSKSSLDDFKEVKSCVIDKDKFSKITNRPDISPTDIVCLNTLEDFDPNSNEKGVYIPRVSPSDSGVSCTSVTVMSGSHCTSQVASSNTSRSSSPGISLMTFALNSDGKGIPGAFYFALGTDSTISQSQNTSTTCCNSPKSPNSYVATYNSDLSQVNTIENEHNLLSDKYHSEKLVNATWLRLRDADNKPISSNTTWRTARAVPSNELFTNKRITKEIIDASITNRNLNDCPYENKEIERHNNSHCVPLDQYYFTSKDLYINSTNKREDKMKINQKINSQLTKKSNLPAIMECSNSKIDLKSLASRNISSAILSYESASKTVSQNKIIKPS